MKLPRLAVDAVVLLEGKVVLVKRKNEPFRGHWALPGGFVEYGETVEQALRREVEEETNLGVEIKRIVGIYSEPDRDPRGHVVSICYLCEAVGGSLIARSDAEDVRTFSKEELKRLKLAFDHDRILRDAGLLG